MEGEIHIFVLVWTTILLSLLYCHTLAKFVGQGTTRLVALIPIVSLFLYLPFNLTSIHFGGFTSLFISWFANFKLILFAFDRGPLYSKPPLPLSRFIPIACFPIEIINVSPKNEDARGRITKTGQKSLANYGIKVLLFGGILMAYCYEDCIHRELRSLLYFFHLYFLLELVFWILASATRAGLGVELKQQFCEPYLTTSVQDFWGNRWNLMASNILRISIYQPVRSLSDRMMKIPSNWAPFPAILVTFFVSGIMHELLIYHMGRLKPTGEMTAYFLINGLWVGIEIAIKKSCKGKFQLPPMLSWPLAFGFVLVTTDWLFLPPFIRYSPTVGGGKEMIAFFEFVAHGGVLRSTKGYSNVSSALSVTCEGLL